MHNVYLIGLPGSGKSTLGWLLAGELGLKFVDLDQVIEQTAKQSITDLFAQKGEEYFRTVESQALEGTIESSGCIVATGGGIVLRPENVALMKRGGIILWLDRPVESILADIDPDLRPLLAGNPERLKQLAAERLPLYQKACDMRYHNQSSQKDALRELTEMVQKNSPSFD